MRKGWFNWNELQYNMYLIGMNCNMYLISQEVAVVPKALPVLGTSLPIGRGGGLQDVDIGGK